MYSILQDQYDGERSLQLTFESWMKVFSNSFELKETSQLKEAEFFQLIFSQLLGCDVIGLSQNLNPQPPDKKER